MHLICAIKQKWQLDFYDEYKRSYCVEHNNLPDQYMAPNSYACFICIEPIVNYRKLDIIPSCCGIGLFHADCLRNYALHAGYYFTCPLCRNKDFSRFAQQYGIYVPER